MFYFNLKEDGKNYRNQFKWHCLRKPSEKFLAKSNNPNTHFRAFFMLYTNQITKVEKTFFFNFD
jgi:hypothetical protein